MANKAAKKTVLKQAVRNEQISPQTVKSEKRLSTTVKLAILLGIISCLVYANTLKNGYVYDDVLLITKNHLISKGFAGIPELLFTPYHRGSFVTTNELYRPLSLITFAMEYQFFGKNPAPSHLINILLFAGCVMLLFLFLDNLFEKRKTIVAFIASLLFALHPIHAEVVANIKSRDELLCFFFAFLCLNVFFKYVTTGKISQLLLGGLCFLLSFLSKETAITFLAVIPLVFFFYKNENKRRSISITLTTVLTVIIFLATRFSVLSYYQANEITNIPFIDNALAKPDIPFDSRIATAIFILGNYLKLLVVPYPLVCDYSFNAIPFVNFENPQVLISLAIYIFLAIFGVKRLLQHPKDPYAFAVLFFLITISLFSNIPFLIGATMGERFMFFCSAGFCLIPALLIDSWIGNGAPTGLTFLKQPKALAIIIPISLVYVGLTINRNADWVDNLSLYSADIEKVPNDSKLNYYLGSELEKSIDPEAKDPAKNKKILEESMSYLRKSLSIYPGFREAQADLGAAYFRNGQYDSAEVFAKMALDLNPKNVDAINNLIAVYNFEKKYPPAIELLKGLVASNPNSENAQGNLGDAFYNNLQYDSAETHLVSAIKLNRENIAAINDLAGIYFFRKKYPEAIELYKTALKLNPNFVNPCANIGVCYLYTNKFDSAVYYSRKAISINPEYNSGYEILASTYKASGNSDSARKYEAVAQKRNKGFRL